MNKIYQSKRVTIVIGAILLTALLAAIGGVVAKYVTERDGVTPISSMEFYFESNYLKENGHEYTLNANTSSISIGLYNFENKNRVSDMACTYTITITSTGDAPDITANGATINNQTITYTAPNTQDTFTFLLSNLKPGATYTVTATSKGGYEKELSATFKVKEAVKSAAYMNVKETEHYVLLTVWTENLAGEATITVPAGLIPDTTDPILKNVTTKNNAFNFEDNQNFTNSTGNSRSYRFFKPANYTGTVTFTVKIGDKEAAKANLPN